MKRLPILLCLLGAAGSARGQESTLAPGASSAWAGTTGWIELRPGRPNPLDGIRVKDTHLAGFGWSDATGWMHFGDGAPANGIRYANAAGDDCGVNHDGQGNLSGLAWSATCGWVNFGWAAPNDPNRPRFDLLSGEFSGYAWGTTIGWISLGNGTLKTATLAFDDADGDGISDAWEIGHAGTIITLTGTGDTDADGVPDREEFLHDTDPLDPADLLQITDFVDGDTSSRITWTTRPTRMYRLFHSTDLQAWISSVLNDIAPDPGSSTTRDQPHPGGSRRFFKVTGVLPLQP